MKKSILLIFLGGALFGKCFYYEFDKKVVLEPIYLKNTRSLSQDEIKFYRTEDGKLVKFKNEIVVKLKEGADANKLFKMYKIKRFKEFAKNRYIVVPQNDEDILILAQKLYANPNIIYAIPNKIKTYIKR